MMVCSQTGRALWLGDVGDTDVATMWAHLFGEPFDKTKAVATHDVGDAAAYVMPGGFVVIDETYPTNHGIYAPPRKLPEGAVWGLKIEPRADPVAMPVMLPLPERYVCTDESRRVYQIPGEGEAHSAKSRLFVHSEWCGTVYVLCMTERRAEREKQFYLRTPAEVVLDEVKNWYDKKGNGHEKEDLREITRLATCYSTGPRYEEIPDHFLSRAIERWYVPTNKACVGCGALNRVHPTCGDVPFTIDGKTLHVRRTRMMKCGACGTHVLYSTHGATREAASRALRYYGPTPVNLEFARVALGLGTRSIPVIDVRILERCEEGACSDPAVLNVYADWLIEKLESIT